MQRLTPAAVGLAILGWMLASGSVAAAPQKHAILVGVSEYANLRDATFADWGPRNSVLLWRQLLAKRGFADVQVLTDGLDLHVPVPGIPDMDDGVTRSIPNAVFPTHANVEAALRRLEAVLASERDASKDEVLIVLIGHGSTQPAFGDPNQPDGRSQVFLLRDTKIALDHQHYENALIDTDVRPYLKVLSAKAGLVWFMFDQCFAASMTYATQNSYALPVGSGLVRNSVSYDSRPTGSAMGAAHAGLAPAGGDFGVVTAHPIGEAHWPTNYLAVYAVSSKDEASTIQRPPAPIDGLLRSKFTGFTALSYFAVQEMDRNPRASFRQILHAVRQGYMTMDVLKALTPLVEGSVTLDRPALP